MWLQVHLQKNQISQHPPKNISYKLFKLSHETHVWRDFSLFSLISGQTTKLLMLYEYGLPTTSFRVFVTETEMVCV